MVMDPKELERLVQALSIAIKNGKVEDAKTAACLLSEKKAEIDMHLLPKDDSKQKIIRVKIHIEDKSTSTSRPLEWALKVSTKIVDLKRMMYKKKGFPIDVQRWIVEKRVASDGDSLSRCGVSEDGHTIFLYLMSPKLRTLEPGLEDEHTYDMQSSGLGDRSGPVTLPTQSSQTPIIQEGGARSMEFTPHPLHTHHANQPPILQGARSMETGAGSMDLRRDEDMQQDGWSCEKCTYLNGHPSHSCSMCRSPRRDHDHAFQYQQEEVQMPQSLPSTAQPHDSYQLPQRPSHDATATAGRAQRPQDFNRPHRSSLQHGTQRPPLLPHQLPDLDNSTAAASSTGGAEGGGGGESPPSSIMVYNHDKMQYEYLNPTSGAIVSRVSSVPNLPEESDDPHLSML